MVRGREGLALSGELGSELEEITAVGEPFYVGLQDRKGVDEGSVLDSNEIALVVVEVDDIYVRERVEVAYEPLSRPPRALGYAAQLSFLQRLEGEYSVRFAVVD
mgnify:CR=1 FL=1